MAGEAALAVLLRSMRPELHAEAYGHAVTDAPLVEAFARIAEAEGMTVIAPEVIVLNIRTKPWPITEYTTPTSIAKPIAP